MWDKSKDLLADDVVFYSLLILLVGIGSFALGKLSERPFLAADGSGEVVMTSSVTTATTTVIASKNGSKYHYPWCPGADSIKPENRLVFDSRAKAEAAGYTAAENCSGL